MKITLFLPTLLTGLSLVTAGHGQAPAIAPATPVAVPQDPFVQADPSTGDVLTPRAKRPAASPKQPPASPQASGGTARSGALTASGGGVGGFGGGGGFGSTIAPYPGAKGGVGSISGGVPPLVVRFSSADDGANAAMEDDLVIMTRLLEEALKHGIGDDAETKMNIPILYSDSRSVRGMYLEGFGPLFMIKVGFPVFAPNAPEPKEPEASADSDWEKAKRALSSEADEGAGELALLGGEPQFDAGRVEELKKLIFQSLKNATNIRHLKPDDYIGVTVFGHPSAAAVATVRVKRSRTSNKPLAPNTGAAGAIAEPEEDVVVTRRYNADAKNTTEVVVQQQVRSALAAKDALLLRSSSQGTVLALRVRKADVDAFAKGQIDLDGFRKKAEQHSYFGSGNGVTSINSWSRSGMTSGMQLR
jgi:hypothetical protein